MLSDSQATLGQDAHKPVAGTVAAEIAAASSFRSGRQFQQADLYTAQIIGQSDAGSRGAPDAPVRTYRLHAGRFSVEKACLIQPMSTARAGQTPAVLISRVGEGPPAAVEDRSTVAAIGRIPASGNDESPWRDGLSIRGRRRRLFGEKSVDDSQHPECTGQRSLASFKGYLVIIAFVWTAAGALSLYWTLRQQNAQTLEDARTRAQRSRNG